MGCVSGDGSCEVGDDVALMGLRAEVGRHGDSSGQQCTCTKGERAGQEGVMGGCKQGPGCCTKPPFGGQLCGPVVVPCICSVGPSAGQEGVVATCKHGYAPTGCCTKGANAGNWCGYA